jgi:hypothetical protein
MHKPRPGPEIGGHAYRRQTLLLLSAIRTREENVLSPLAIDPQSDFAHDRKRDLALLSEQGHIRDEINDAEVKSGDHRRRAMSEMESQRALGCRRCKREAHDLPQHRLYVSWTSILRYSKAWTTPKLSLACLPPYSCVHQSSPCSLPETEAIHQDIVCLRLSATRHDARGRQHHRTDIQLPASRFIVLSISSMQNIQ